MTVLKWLLIVVSVGYVGGLAVLFFAQRALLFPIPTGRAHDAASGRFSASRRTCADHGGRREGHRLARSGQAGPAGGSLFPRQWRFSRRLLRPLSRPDRRRHRGSSRCPIAAMPDRAGSPSENGPAAGRSCRLCLHDGAIQRGQDRRLGFFARHRRRGGAGCGTAGRQDDSGSALYLDRGRGRAGVSGSPGASGDAGSIPLRRAHRQGRRRRC